MSTVEQIRSLLTTALQPETLEIIDDSALHAGHAGAREGGHYRVLIVCTGFAGKRTMERHRMVHAALQTLMPGKIHALSISAKAPGE